MNHTIAMHILEADNYACDKEFSLLFCETLFLVVMVSEIATSDQVCDEVDIFKINKRVEHID